MAFEKKRLLIVDDMEIDRIILKSVLSREFDIQEASNGNMAFEYLTTQGDQLDAILLDIAMPHIDGFDVLRFISDKGLAQIPVFLVTAEPTRDNVQRALQYNIAGFIGKPFDREDILRRLRSRLGVIPEYELKNEDLRETRAYIADLDALYKTYLTNFGLDDTHFKIRADLMRIMLTTYNKTTRELRMNSDAVDLVSKAAYFCDIGEMLVPDKRLQLISASQAQNKLPELQQAHPQLGSSLIRLNRAKSCEYFVEICASMCLHHHERWDGKGYPDGIVGKNNSVFNQLCRLVDEFDMLRSKFFGDKARPVRFVIKRMTGGNESMVEPKLYALLEDCEPQFVDYYMKL